MALTIENFIFKIEEEFEDLPKGSVTPDGEFRKSMDWNSMNALLLMALISSEYDVNIGADELRNCNTVRDVYNIILEKKSS